MARSAKPTKTQIEALRVYAGESSGYATRAAFKHLLERGWIQPCLSGWLPTHP